MAVSDFVVCTARIWDELFSHCDHHVELYIGIDDYPVGILKYGKFTTGIILMPKFRATSTKPVYQRTVWINEVGLAVANGELLTVLDEGLQNFLHNWFKAKLYDLSQVPLPPAKVVRHTKWDKFIEFVSYIL